MMQPAQHRLCDNLKADRQTTSVGHFELIGDVERAHVGKIAYFESITELLAMTATRKSPFDDALVKRAAFPHEREVRYPQTASSSRTPASHASGDRGFRKGSASCGHRPVRPKQPQRIGKPPLRRALEQEHRKLLILLALRKWLLRLDSNQQPSG